MCTRVMPTRRALAARVELERALGRERLIVLRDLIALRQVRIEVVLAREDRLLVNRAAERQRRLDRQLDGAAVEHRQRARQPEADGTECVFGARAERVLQPQKILVSVSSWAWISRPMTGS